MVLAENSQIPEDTSGTLKATGPQNAGIWGQISGPEIQSSSSPELSNLEEGLWHLRTLELGAALGKVLKSGFPRMPNT